MTFKRLLMPLMVMGIILTMGNMAFAVSNVQCGLGFQTGVVGAGSTPIATSNGHTEPIAVGTLTPAALTPGGGALRVTCNNYGTGSNGTDPGLVVLTVQLSTQITNSTVHPGTNALAPSIRLATGTGNFIATGAGTNVSINSINVAAGQIVIAMGTPAPLPAVPSTGITYTDAPVPGFPGGTPFTSTFDILGILVSVQGKTGPITASLTTTGGVSITSGQGSLNVITATAPGLKDPTLASTIPTFVSTSPGFVGVTSGPAVLNSAGTALKGNFTLRIEEGYIDMFREATQFNGGGTFPASPSSDTQVNIQLNNVPSGLNISSCAAILTNAAGDAASPAATAVVNATNITAASPILTINFAGATDLANIEVLWVTCTSVSSGTATLPLPSLSVSAQVYLGPTGIAVSTATGNPALTTLIAGQIPRYHLLLQPATGITVVVFPPSTSNLLITFGAVSPGYNTGIAISNTSMDPFTPAGGGAANSEGTLTFTMYKSDGTSKAYTTTTGSPGSGYTGAGVLKAGSTYAVQLSDLLAAASFGTTFNGYIFVTANFTNAHGAATIYVTTDGSAALSSPVIVLPPVSTATPRGTFESFGL